MTFAVSAALIVRITFLALGRRTGWCAPVLTGLFSAVWGLGLVGLIRFNFDPVMLAWLRSRAVRTNGTTTLRCHT
jgi:hypothetical protein